MSGMTFLSLHPFPFPPSHSLPPSLPPSLPAVLFIEVSSFQGVLIRGVPAILFIEVSSFQGVIIRGVPAVLFIEVSSFQGDLIRGVPAVLFIEVSSFQGVLIRGVPAVLFIEVSGIGEGIKLLVVMSGMIYLSLPPFPFLPPSLSLPPFFSSSLPDVLFIEVSSFQGVLIRGVPAVLFIEVSSFQGILIRGVPAILIKGRVRIYIPRAKLRAKARVHTASNARGEVRSGL